MSCGDSTIATRDPLSFGSIGLIYCVWLDTLTPRRPGWPPSNPFTFKYKINLGEDLLRTSPFLLPSLRRLLCTEWQLHSLVIRSRAPVAPWQPTSLKASHPESDSTALREPLGRQTCRWLRERLHGCVTTQEFAGYIVWVCFYSCVWHPAVRWLKRAATCTDCSCLPAIQLQNSEQTWCNNIISWLFSHDYRNVIMSSYYFLMRKFFCRLALSDSNVSTCLWTGFS